MNRRDFLQCAALLAAGTAAAPPGWSLNDEQKAFLAAQADYIDREPPSLFDPRQRAAVIAAAEQVIPATDTPGATDAGAARFIELMVSDWFDPQERERFLAGLADLQQRADGDFGALDPAAQLAILEALEDEASDAPWYRFGNITRVWDSEAPFICQFKELTVLGFMLSEVGGTRFLRENPLGSFDGERPLGEDDPAWAVETPLRTISEGASL
jgi:hypothetical protein